MKLNLYRSFYLSIIVLFVVAGCEKEYESIEELDAKDIQTYIKQNSLSSDFLQYKNTGIYYKVITHGTGDTVKYSDKIFATFTAKSLDGKFNMQADSLNRFSSFLGYFSNAYGYPDAFSTAIKEILNKKNGTIRLIIPSHLAYGRGGNSSLDIPGNASLDCTIKLYDVSNTVEFEDVFVKRYFETSKIDINSFKRTSDGLYYQVITPGTGAEIVNSGSVITVSYTGKLTNGAVFDSSSSFESALGSLIPAWQLGLTQQDSPIKKGGKVRLITPPSLAYGSNPSGSIPSYSTLDFVIEILDIK